MGSITTKNFERLFGLTLGVGNLNLR